MGCIFHKWDGCKCLKCGMVRDRDHQWNGCTCKTCGKKRDESHSWDGCVCRICGQKRDRDHVWEGCTCGKCGKHRDKGHAFRYEPIDATTCMAVCEKCGHQEKEPHHFKPVSGQCYSECSRCHKKTEPVHRFSFIPERCVQKCTVCGAEEEKHSPVPEKDTDRIICRVCGKELMSGLRADEKKAVETLMTEKRGYYGTGINDRTDAARKLGSSRHPRAVEALGYAAVNDTVLSVREEALIALGKVASANSEIAYVDTGYFIKALQDEPSAAKIAATTLGILKREDAVAPLIRFIDSRKSEELNDQQVEFAIMALGNIGTPEADRYLIKSLDEAKSEKRVNAIWHALEKIRPRSALKELEPKYRSAQVRARKRLLGDLKSFHIGMPAATVLEKLGASFSIQSGMGDPDAPIINCMIPLLDFGVIRMSFVYGKLKEMNGQAEVIAKLQNWIRANEKK